MHSIRDPRKPASRPCAGRGHSREEGLPFRGLMWAILTRASLPDEAPDVTVSDLHERVVNRLVDVLRFIFSDKAVVLLGIFTRVRGAGGP